MINKKNLIEIIWVGRGGQGVVTAAQLTAVAALKSGYIGVSVVPSFGAERRGAPVEAYLRLSDEKINIYSTIETADFIIILDDSLSEKIRTNSIKPGKTKIVINSIDKNKINSLKKNQDISEIFSIDASGISKNLNLSVSGNIIINTTVIGAFIKALDVIEMNSLKQAFAEKFSEKSAELNYSAAERAYFETVKIN